MSLFYVCFIPLFCLIAIWKARSEWLTTNSVNFHCQYFEILPLSLLSLQQVPWEPRWTWAGVSGSTSWQEPRPFLLVVNKWQSALPPLQAPVRWFSQRAGPAPVQFPPSRPLLPAPCFSQLDPPESGGGLVLQEMFHTCAASRSCFLRCAPAQCGCLPGFSPLCFWSFNCSTQVSFGHGCLLVLLAHSASLLDPELSSLRSYRPHPDPDILGPHFSSLSTASLLLSKHSTPCLS